MTIIPCNAPEMYIYLGVCLSVYIYMHRLQDYRAPKHNSISLINDGMCNGT